MRILFVCTGNVCRSPLAERLAIAWAHDSLRQSPEREAVIISSAGTDAGVGLPMDPRSSEALTDLGGDPVGFRSRTLTSALADEADIVLTMTRRQRRDVLEKAPRGLRRTFTLTEAAELMGSADLAGLKLLPLAQRARELGLRLAAARSHRRSRETDDVLDPFGRSLGVHRDVAATIATALRPVADVLFASVRPLPAVPVDDETRDRTVEPVT